MLLSEIGNIFGFKVVNDPDIKNLKLLFQNKKNSLVYVTDDFFLEEALIDQDVKAIIAPLNSKTNNSSDIEIIYSEDPKALFFEIHQHLLQKTFFYYKRLKSTISNSAKISSNASISPYNVTIEDNVIIDDFVTIEANVHIAANCHIKPGCHIGGDGLMVVSVMNSLKIVPHGGAVYIGAGSVIGANSVIDKGLFNDTTHIGENTLIDSLVRVAHNSQIGKNCIIAGNASISGSVKIHNNVYIEPNATIGTKIIIGNNAHVGTGTVVIENIPENKHVIGRASGHIPVIK